MSAQVVYISAIVAILCVFCGGATAQNQTISCSEAPSLVINGSVTGSWYEVARNPAPASSVSCLQLNITQLSNNSSQYNVSITYSTMPSMLWMNQTSYDVVTINSTSTEGYNVSFSTGVSSSPNVTYKLLDTDYQNYAFVCGYTNATNNATSFGVVLTRERFINSTLLNQYETLAARNYSDFSNSTMTNITQSISCYYKNSAATSMPIVSALFAIVFALLKFVN